LKRVVLRRWQLALAEFILSAPLPSEFLWAGKTGWKTVRYSAMYAEIIGEPGVLGQHKRVLLCGQK